MSSAEQNTEPSDKRALFSALGFIGAFGLFLFILYIAYLPNRPGAVDRSLVKKREALLAENKATQLNAANTYGWVDQSRGIVRIPVERAMKLTVQEQHLKDN